jgi:hypothetical protein
MEQIRVGERVRVINRRLVHAGQRGTVIRAGAEGGFYVHLDYDHDLPHAGTFFHAEELEPVTSNAAQNEQPHDDPLPDERQGTH